MAISNEHAALERIRQIRRAIIIFVSLLVVWWIVEFITYSGRSGVDAFDFVALPIICIGGWLVYQAWRARCPRCGNQFFINRSLALGCHFTSECPYCGINLKQASEAAG
jgi:hypothetical protein